MVLSSLKSKALSALMAFILAVGLCPTPALAATSEGSGKGIAATTFSSPSIALVGDVTTESITLSVNASDLPDGARLYVSKFSAADFANNSAPGYGAGTKLFDSRDNSWFTFGNGDNMFYIGTGKLQAGEYVIAYILDGWTITAQSEGVAVKAAGATDPDPDPDPDTPNPTAPTRQQIIDACSVSMASPHGDGTFKLTDTSADISVTLHESVTFARLRVIAFPKAASFDPDNVTYNKTVFSTMVRNGEAVSVDQVTANFDLSTIDTTYNLVAYLYYQVPPEEEYDYQYKTSRSFQVVDSAGATTEAYTFPDASIVEEELPVGATCMHVNLTGDERLFKLANDTKDEWLSNRFSIHVGVYAYDNDGELFDFDENPGEKLWDEEALAPFTNRTITLASPLEEGKRVIAAVYWTNYTGEAAAMPVPKGNDYGSERVNGVDSQSVLVTKDAAPITPSTDDPTEPETPDLKAPQATIGLDGNDVELTQGDKFISLKWEVDPLAENVSYKLYQFTGDELDESKDAVVSKGTLTTGKYNYKGVTSVSIGSKLEAGAKLQLVLSAGKQKTASNVMTVGATPAWAQVYPTVAFAQNAVKTNASTVKLVVNYPEEYLSLGSEFFCNVSVYQYPGSYTDEDFEDDELDENPSIAKVVAGMNSKNGKTNGELELAFGNGASLTPGSRLIAKIRLPQAERQDHDSMWEDYLSMSIPVVSADANVPAESVLLYNLSADTAKGGKLRDICMSLGLAVRDLQDADLAQKVGYLAGRSGFEAASEAYAGAGYGIEYMLIANVSEASLDRLLAAMSDAGISVGAKGITTDTNVNWTLERLVGNIAEEHETMTALVSLRRLVWDASELDKETYGQARDWDALQKAIEKAEALYTSGEEEPTAEALTAAHDELEPLYLSVSDLAKFDGAIAITAQKQADGSYTLTATRQGGTSKVSAEKTRFIWNDKDETEGAVLTGVPADKVGARIVSAQGDDAYGTLTAQLLAPAQPSVVVSANEGSIDVSWDPADDAFNQPAATSYKAELYRGDACINTVTGDKPAFSFTGLFAGNYTVKACSVNIAGRSDKAVESVTLDKGASVTPAPASNPQKVTPVVTMKKTSFTYTGKVIKPAVTVKVNGRTLTSGYTVSYSKGCKNVGTYKATVTLNGQYSGAGTVAFSITPKATALSKVSATSKGFTVSWKKQAAQTTGYQIAYSTKSNFKSARIVTVSGKKAASAKVAKLKAKKKYYVRVRTYKAIGKAKLYSAWSKAKAVTTKH